MPTGEPVQCVRRTLASLAERNVAQKPCPWQAHGERRPLLVGGLDLNGTAVSAHDLVDDVQAEPQVSAIATVTRRGPVHSLEQSRDLLAAC